MEKMSNNNNDIGNVMKSQGYYVPTPSIPSPMPSKDNILLSLYLLACAVHRIWIMMFCLEREAGVFHH